MTGFLYYQIGVIASMKIQTDSGEIPVGTLKDIPAIMKRNDLSSIVVVGDIKFFPPIDRVSSEMRGDNIILRLKEEKV